METLEQKKVNQVLLQAGDLIRCFAPHYTLKLNKRFKRVLGQTRYNKKEIHLQYRYILYCEMSTILDTVMHEIAHTIAIHQGHNKVWRRTAESLYCRARPSKRFTLANEITLLD